jgi:hypothetical protein
MPSKQKQGLNKTLAFRVSDETYDSLELIMERERRIESDVSRELLKRGLAAYRRDGRLFEPEEPKSKRTMHVAK